MTARRWRAGPDALRDGCRDRGLPLHVFEWTPACEAAGLQRGAVYLIRPDTHVAIVETPAEVAQGDPVARLVGWIERAGRGEAPVV